MRIVSISDIHGYLVPKLPKGDVLTVSGDICPVRGSHHPSVQINWVNQKFMPWCGCLIERGTVRHVVIIAGNHDFVFQSSYMMDVPPGVHYLEDDFIQIDGKKIYGTPWTRYCGDWAFSVSEAVLQDKFARIPDGMDIVLAHTPAYGYNDTIMQCPGANTGDPHIGSTALLDHVKRAKPKMLIVGHIHSGSHKHEEIPHDGGFTVSVNVSIMDEDYNPSYQPLRSVM